MTAAPIAFFIALFLAIVFTPLASRLARAIGAVDRGGSSSRKVHGRAIPRLGGLAIIAAFYVPLSLLLLTDSSVGRTFSEDAGMVFGLFAGGLAIGALGLLDDLYGTSAWQKLGGQFAVAIALFLLGFRIETVSIPFGPTLDLGVFAAAITCLWIVGVINAVNLIDGLDGLAAGVALLAALTTLFIGAADGQTLMMLFMACLSGALLGFLAYNFNPARIFMGDTGSMFLGFVLAVTTVQTSTKSQATVALLVPVLALGLPIMDTAIAMGRRFLTGRRVMRADRGHLHHRLLDLGLTQKRAVLALYGISLVFCLAALSVAAEVVSSLAILVGALALSAVAIRLVRGGSRQTLAEKARELHELRRYNRRLERSAKQAQMELQTATSLDAIWNRVVAAARPLSPSAMYLLGVDFSRDQHKSLCVWPSADRENDPSFSTAYPIDLPTGEVCLLELYWADGRSELSDAEGALLETLTKNLPAPLERMLAEGGDVVVFKPQGRAAG